MLKLYSTNCPKCEVLEKKLKAKGHEFDVETDTSVMLEKGFKEVPILEVDGVTYNFTEAVNWLNNN